MNIKHSSESEDWYTPIEIVDMVHEVLGNIKLDPASCEEANIRIQANRIYTKEDDALSQEWAARSIYLNPPGGKNPSRGYKSNTVMFWDKLMKSQFGHAIFMAFSIEALQATQKCGLSMLDYPICVPKSRLRFDKPCGTKSNSPTHSSVIAYVPAEVDRTDLFIKTFSKLGACKK